MPRVGIFSKLTWQNSCSNWLRTDREGRLSWSLLERGLGGAWLQYGPTRQTSSIHEE